MPRLKQNRSRGAAGEDTRVADKNATSADDVVPNMGCRHHNLKSYAISFHVPLKQDVA